MKVIEKGHDETGWSAEHLCSGHGNGGGGCGAKLLIEFNDLYVTTGGLSGIAEDFSTFQCVECSVETDIDLPTRVKVAIRQYAPNKDEPNRDRWLASITEHCKCCVGCADVPCGGCQQGAPCDARRCTCEPDERG